MDCIYEILLLHSEAMEYTCQAVVDPGISLEGAQHPAWWLFDKFWTNFHVTIKELALVGRGAHLGTSAWIHHCKGTQIRPWIDCLLETDLSCECFHHLHNKNSESNGFFSFKFTMNLFYSFIYFCTLQMDWSKNNQLQKTKWELLEVRFQ